MLATSLLIFSIFAHVGRRIKDPSAIIATGNNVIPTALDFRSRFPGHGSRMLRPGQVSVNAPPEQPDLQQSSTPGPANDSDQNTVDPFSRPTPPPAATPAATPARKPTTGNEGSTATKPS